MFASALLPVLARSVSGRDGQDQTASFVLAFAGSGVMANQLAIGAHMGTMESIVCDSRAHIFVHEGGAPMYHARAKVTRVSSWEWLERWPRGGVEDDVCLAAVVACVPSCRTGRRRKGEHSRFVD